MRFRGTQWAIPALLAALAGSGPAFAKTLVCGEFGGDLRGSVDTPTLARVGRVIEEEAPECALMLVEYYDRAPVKEDPRGEKIRKWLALASIPEGGGFVQA